MGKSGSYVNTKGEVTFLNADRTVTEEGKTSLLIIPTAMSTSAVFGNSVPQISSSGDSSASFSSFDITKKNAPIVDSKRGGHSLSYDIPIFAVPYMILEAGLTEGFTQLGMDANDAHKTAQLTTFLYSRKKPQRITNNTGIANKSSEVTEALLKAANFPDKNGLTVVGRALQKHGSRVGSVFPKATGNAAAINTQGNTVLQNILNHPNASFTARHHARFGNVIEYKIPGGQGARFSGDGKKFIGFIEN